MPLPIPHLDDCTFDQLAAEARALIPRYCPTWTDHNASDPGITLLELFAFVMEAAIYRLNRIPDATLENFAALVGIVRELSEPVDNMLRRTVESVAANNRAVTSGDMESIVTRRVIFFLPALDLDYDAGTDVETQFLSSDDIRIAGNVEAGATELCVSPQADVKPGDELLIEDAEHTEFVEVVGVNDDESNVAVTRLRFPHAKNAMLRRILREVEGTRARLALPARKNDSVVVLDRSIELSAGSIFRVGDVTLGRMYFARVKVIVNVAPAGDLIVTLVFVPGLRGKDGWPTTPDEQLCERVFEFLRPRCLLTTRLEVAGPDYQSVEIKATVIRDQSSRLPLMEVRRAAEAAIRNFLDPLKGGPEGTGWEFGRHLFVSELYRIIEEVPGVDHVHALTPTTTQELSPGKWYFRPTEPIEVTVLH